jgi:hypothetical protein
MEMHQYCRILAGPCRPIQTSSARILSGIATLRQFWGVGSVSRSGGLLKSTTTQFSGKPTASSITGGHGGAGPRLEYLKVKLEVDRVMYAIPVVHQNDMSPDYNVTVAARGRA